jgi:hypothetical protein
LAQAEHAAAGTDAAARECWVMIQILSPKRKADFWATPFSQVAAGGAGGRQPPAVRYGS